MNLDDTNKELEKKVPGVKVLDIQEHPGGKVSMEVSVGPKELAFLDKHSRIPAIQMRAIAADSSIIRRDALIREDLDNTQSNILTLKPSELFQRSIDYSKTKDIYGTVIRNLSNFASRGFENDIDDDDIKNFYDNWVMDTGFDTLLDQIFFDIFRVGMVRTYKVIGKYSPQVNIFPDVAIPGFDAPGDNGTATAARKKRWSKEHIPLKYTILNPTMIEIAGSMLFNQAVVTLKAGALDDLKELLELPSAKLSPEQKKVISTIPAAMKDAAKNRRPYVLDPSLVGEIDYRKQPYERYPMPRGVNAFESIEYKDELRKADLSTLDGISNYILKITVGNDEFPVTSQEVLENVGELFNTNSKSFNVVWNHTLDIEKIVSPEIEAILGQDKYKQVNDDYTGALGFTRALIDGGGTISTAGAGLAIKSIIAEVEYVRRQVRNWIYKEYQQVALAAGFNRFPVVRFSDIDLRDEIQMMKVLQGMIDRRIMSYETGIKRLGLDSSTEISRLAKEKDMVLDGSLGIIGSPYNPKAVPPMVQDTQKTPTGTPSEGRPVGTGTPKTKADFVDEEDYLDNILDSFTEDQKEYLLNKLSDKD